MKGETDGNKGNGGRSGGAATAADAFSTPSGSLWLELAAEPLPLA